MEFFNRIITHYGWEGTALAGVLLVMFGIQLYYYLFVYGRIPKYKDTRRPEILSETPPVSVVIPLFSEDYAFVEEILPLIVAQEYPDFEVVIVYVGRDTDFYDDLVRIKQSFPQITATKIELNPRFPISPKMALNVGIKSAHYEHLLFTTPDVYPTSDRWLSLMANGFRRGEIVLGYCGMERGKGIANSLIRTWRMMHSVDWISSAVCGRPYRGMRQNYGFTKRLYFGANGFSHLNMNIGEDDLFMSRIIAPGNVSVVLSPRATLREKSWGGLRWWIGTQRFFGGAIPFYPLWVKNFIQWELGSRILFWLAAIVALAVMPWEFKIAAGVLLLARFAIVLVEARRISRRLGEEKICGRYFLYDLLSPFFALLLGLLLLRKDERVWRKPTISKPTTGRSWSWYCRATTSPSNTFSSVTRRLYTGSSYSAPTTPWTPTTCCRKPSSKSISTSTATTRPTPSDSGFTPSPGTPSSISSGGARRTCPSTTNSRHRPPTTPRPKRTSSANSSARRSNATSRPCRHATDN